MAAYATADDVIEVIVRDASDDDEIDGTAASLPPDVIDAQIAAAQAEVDARIGVRYAVPLAQPPLLIRGLTADIAAYLCTLIYRRDSPETKSSRQRYERAEKLLGQIGSGQIALSPDSGIGNGGSSFPSASGAPPTVRNPYAGALFPIGSFGLDRDPDIYSRSWRL